jgi:hypothetical protein
VFLFQIPSRRRRSGTLLALLSCVFLATGVGCGGGSSGASHIVNAGTPTGNYAVTVTATSGNLSRSSGFNLTVQ